MSPGGAAALLVLAGAVQAALAEGPCDILDAAGNTCVAAHSTTRALYAEYSGALYNVSRPDGTWKSIGLLSPGGFADKKAHDAFCAEGDCVISNVYDQVRTVQCGSSRIENSCHAAMAPADARSLSFTA
eukprot:SAG31_NODE_2935_length_4895_cov_5.362177_1_plen_129_part_00